VTGFSKAAGLILIIYSLLWILVGAALIFIGRTFLGSATTRPDLGIDLDALSAGVAVFGVILLVLGIVQLLAGVFAWRGSGAARVLGVIFGLLWGLLFLLGALGGASSSQTNDATASGLVFTLVLAAGYLYSAGALMFAWRR
jgi:hypothetical protein